MHTYMQMYISCTYKYTQTHTHTSRHMKKKFVQYFVHTYMYKMYIYIHMCVLHTHTHRGGHAGGSRRSRDRTRSRGMLGWGLVWVAVGHKETQHKRALALAQADANDTTAVRDPSGCSAPHRAPRLKRAFRAQRAGSSEPASRSAAEADGTWRLRRLPPACPPRAARGLLPAI